MLWPVEPLLAAVKITLTADVLDIGAGHGTLLEFLQAQGHQGRLMGIDPVPGACVLGGTAGALPFADASFDVALMVRMLSHVPDEVLTLKEARRVVRPSGLLVVAAHGEGHLAAWWKAGGHSAGAPQSFPAGFTRQDIRIPVTITAAANLVLARSYGLEPVGLPTGTLSDELHLLMGTQNR
ncbi:MAG: Methyltransferase type 11 [Deinococcus sp.]|nr:Methyltransferase type 11 [Deinococcus sp.]